MYKFHQDLTIIPLTLMIHSVVDPNSIHMSEQLSAGVPRRACAFFFGCFVVAEN